MASTDHTPAELERAFCACGIARLTLDQAMAHPALSLAIRLMADCQRRRASRPVAARRFDAKRAQANDID